MIPQITSTEKRCSVCGALMDLMMGREKVAFWRCVADERHLEPLAV